MAHAPDRPPGPSHPDMLAAVVLHTLVAAGSRALTPRQVILACERDPHSAAECREVQEALRSLIADGLAESRGGRVASTRAARRADALSF